MSEPTRRRGHAAASARILSAGLSSAAAFGMVAGMAVTAAGQPMRPAGPGDALPADADLAPAVANPATAPSEVVVVIRRHWVAAPSASGTPPTPTAPPSAPLLVTTPARPAPVAAPAPTPVAAARPTARPVTRTRGS